MTEPTPRVLAILPGFTASTLLDVVQPLLSLQSRGKIRFQTKLEFYTTLSDLKRADVVIFCRNAEPKYIDLLNTVCNLHIPCIYDLDDNLFDVPLDTTLGQYYHAPERQMLMKRYLHEANLVRIYSKNMLTRIQEIDCHAELVTVPLIWTNYHLPAVPVPHERVRIVYVTSRNEDRLFNICLPALQQVLSEYPDRVEVFFWGFLPITLKGHQNVHFLAPIRNYRTFSQQFCKRGFDIGLAPLIDDAFHRSKTNNKFREYSACGIAGIYSDMEVYSDCVQNGETGLLVSNDLESWHAALVRLIEEPALRRSISQKAMAYSRKQYSEEQFQQTWLEQILTVKENDFDYRKPVKEVRERVFPIKPVKQIGLLEKVGWIFDRIRTESLQSLIVYFQLQVQNLWLLFKINRMKQL